MPTTPKSPAGIDELITVMARLRAPVGGCPWDLEQNFDTIAPYTIEEAYEVLDAIERNDMGALKDELGDLLLQVVYHARMAEELELFNFDDVASQSAAKMIRRHPHVFEAPDATLTASHQVEAWEGTKATERQNSGPDRSALDGVALALPALTRAAKIQKRAARVGFDWKDSLQVLDKISEEIEELRHEIAVGSGPDRLEDELGDVLFSVVNLARRLKLDPEFALKASTAKFTRRFNRVEAYCRAAGIPVRNQSAEALDIMWQSAKVEETGESVD